VSLGKTLCVAIDGVKGTCVEVEAHLASAIPAFSIVGLPDASLGEAKDRVRAAVSSAGLRWPLRRITVNLVPASLPKSGAIFDLAIAVAVLVADRSVSAQKTRDIVHLGELGLDGRLRPVRGVLPAVAAAVKAGFHKVVVPEDNAAEARLVPGAEVVGAQHLGHVAALYGAECEVPELRASNDETKTIPDTKPALDLADVLGQVEGTRALEVAAAGGHHLFMTGPPGAGKTMLARRLPTILPNLNDSQAVEVTSVHSVAGTFDPAEGLMTRPPFEDPHHTATPGAMVGGGSRYLRPGSVSRAHHGVLFLDEAPEFSPRVLDTLRQPLEQGEVTVHRAASVACFPAKFQLILAANPCPCGKAVGKGLDCECTPMARRRYATRLSGPLLDRVDLQLEIRALTRARLTQAESETSVTSEQAAQRVVEARERQAHRWAGTSWQLNSHVPGDVIRRRLATKQVRSVMKYLERGAITLRGMDRVLRVAWTIADLNGHAQPSDDDIGMALALRTRGRVAGR